MGYGSGVEQQLSSNSGTSVSLNSARLPSSAEIVSQPLVNRSVDAVVAPPLPSASNTPEQELAQVRTLLEGAVSNGILSKAASEIILRKYQSTDMSASRPWSNITRSQVEQTVELARELSNKFGAAEASNRIDQSLTHDGRGFAQLSQLAQSGKLFEAVFSFFQAKFRPYEEFLEILRRAASPAVTLVAYNGVYKPDSSYEHDDHNHNGGGSPITIPTGNLKSHVVYAGRHIASRFSGIEVVYGYANKAGGHGEGVALDFMVPTRSNLGRQIAEYAMYNHEKLGVKYVIWGQKIWNVERDGAPKPWSEWRTMEDRGDDTQNHWDHPHVEFFHSPPRGVIA